MSPPAMPPTVNHAAVTPNRLPRPASVIGVIDDSIDSPHGDQIPRIAATTATGTASSKMGSIGGPA
ncbi:MAG: hypothetical protein U0P45_15460 [Acidimicrobiales bacterium]